MTSTPTLIVAYLALFGTVGFFFIFAALLLGRFLRINNPTAGKLAVYECGEPAVGSGFVQFDLRFYVVALLFIIFDVEVAFFFPWATVYGKATQLMDPDFQTVASAEDDPGACRLSPAASRKFQEMGVSSPSLPKPTEGKDANVKQIEADARLLAKTAIVDIGVFFTVLLVGFAYVWKRGDLNWVRGYDEPPGGGSGDGNAPSTASES